MEVSGFVWFDIIFMLSYVECSCKHQETNANMILLNLLNFHFTTMEVLSIIFQN